MKRAFAVTILAVAAFLSGCGSSEADKGQLVRLLESSNSGLKVRKYTVTYFIEGTVNPRALGWIEDGRSRARLGCFKMIMSWEATGGIESERDQCIYYVDGPDGGGRLWNNDSRAFLEGIMNEHGFESR